MDKVPRCTENQKEETEDGPRNRLTETFRKGVLHCRWLVCSGRLRRETVPVTHSWICKRGLLLFLSLSISVSLPVL